MPTTVRVITTPDLVELNRRAVKAKRNRSFTDDTYYLLDPDGIHVVAWSMLHNDVEIRAHILMKFTGQEAPVNGYLDMSIEDFNTLEILEVEQ